MNQSLPDILLIDNTPRRGGKVHPRIRLMEEILIACPAVVRTIHYRDVGPASADGAAAIVLSGSAHNMSEPPTREAMRSVVELVRDTRLPVLGICFGFHLLLHAYGCEIRRNPQSGEFRYPDGLVKDIHVTRGGGIMAAGRHPVNVAHRDYVRPDDPALAGRFVVHAVSRDGEIEYLQYASHVERPIHAVQFHPEAFAQAPDEVKRTGVAVLHGFVAAC
ncbi:MAG: GMP synthase (glutamine-hydrolyzing) [Planctomycetes bacterium ADurb.Bin126]|nr:MAG: GMP synthase (glutamine-hydrolyzing) [Planctomycetes bacterium ADurb.Bin126]HOD82612.1 gamma-glutamyl-gamma-aminobutyrate hydrolase family protein [Phycisphaerae bacterium]HQL75035.1 gamma-glutamyl-gamma-aminobutyrate hydrolase family protein [Phycisphaerae bacterium]